MLMDKSIGQEDKKSILALMKTRFEENKFKINGLDWKDLQNKLEDNPEKIWSLVQMEETGGEPHPFSWDTNTSEISFIDCSKESPKGRRSLCYDREALESRKKFKPENSVMDLAQYMGIEVLDEELYHRLQSFDAFDCKSSSWLKTPYSVRKLGGGIFGDFRFGRVFIYHNGADSYYAARGFRGVLKF